MVTIFEIRVCGFRSKSTIERMMEEGEDAEEGEGLFAAFGFARSMYSPHHTRCACGVALPACKLVESQHSAHERATTMIHVFGALFMAISANRGPWGRLRRGSRGRLSLTCL